MGEPIACRKAFGGISPANDGKNDCLLDHRIWDRSLSRLQVGRQMPVQLRQGSRLLPCIAILLPANSMLGPLGRPGRLFAEAK